MRSLRDVRERWDETRRETLAEGMICDFIEAEVTTPQGSTMRRQWINHPGAVSIIVLDDDDRVAVVHQYRHPVHQRLVEPPAGILDVNGESPLDAARRELAEEAGLAAEEWYVLADLFVSPGGSDERLRVYLAQGISEAPRPDGFELSDEESDMGLHWVPFDDLADAVRNGEVQNPGMVTGVLALGFALATGGVESLRPGDSPWPAHEAAVG